MVTADKASIHMVDKSELVTHIGDTLTMADGEGAIREHQREGAVSKVYLVHWSDAA